MILNSTSAFDVHIVAIGRLCEDRPHRLLHLLTIRHFETFRAPNAMMLESGKRVGHRAPYHMNNATLLCSQYTTGRCNARQDAGATLS